MENVAILARVPSALRRGAAQCAIINNALRAYPSFSILNFPFRNSQELLLADLSHTAHIRLQRLRDCNRAVLTQVVLEECDQHTRRCNNGVVQRVCEVQLLRILLAADTDAQTARLCVAEVGAGADLEVLLLARRPCLYVAGFDLQVSQVAGAALERAYRNIERTEEIDRVLPQLPVPRYEARRVGKEFNSRLSPSH